MWQAELETHLLHVNCNHNSLEIISLGKEES